MIQIIEARRWEAGEVVLGLRPPNISSDKVRRVRWYGWISGEMVSSAYVHDDCGMGLLGVRRLSRMKLATWSPERQREDVLTATARNVVDCLNTG
ncbi:hypothetical protein ABZV75_27790 [Streptomyces flaveolus]|uniref:hypothetical protein n=1 Tax=Streptomyces flaveolus TaxID=67297 RepID=UPI0033AD7B5C